MRKNRSLLFYLLIFISIHSLPAKAQSSGKLSNAQYEIELKKDASVMITHKQSHQTYRLFPRFTVMKRRDDPALSFKGGALSFMKQPIGAVRVPHWTSPDGKKSEADFFKVTPPIIVSATKGQIKSNSIEWNFVENNNFSIKASLSVIESNNEPVISYTFIPKEEGYYSIGYTGMPEISPIQSDAIWQPPVWQEKRFPELSFLSTEDMCCSLPGTMVETGGMTLGVLADPSMIPYRLPYQPKGNIKFGVLIRNQKGNAQPMLFSPVLGNPDSKMASSQNYSFKVKILIYQGKQPDAYIYSAQHIFGFKDYRKNVYANLNQTIENMVDFQMDDIYSRWSADMKGFDYSTDVANTVKNVSSLHPLSVALITDNKGIYQRRALPMIEYLMSREKYLFSVNKNITRQQPSSRMRGPAVEVSEMAALNIFYNHKSPIFGYFADSLSHTSRQLNLIKVSKGDDWPNLLSLYKMTGTTTYLDSAKKKADEYIQWRITNKQTDFSDACAVQAAQFWTDYAPLWIEMLNLYEATNEKKYLDAAEEGAKLYLQYIWFYPVIPDSTIKVNKNGIVNFRCIEAVRDKIPAMSAPQQDVPAWQVSQIGLTPEASNTISWNPAIFLTHFAPHLLRLAYYTKKDIYRGVARSAVVGRYTNYPGYDIDGEFNTVYSRPDYPLRFQHEVSYNQFYYNHVWPQIAMLFDYLISDVYASSDGKINFPGELAVGYAYLKSNVYGQSAGSFYEDKNVNLWMPRQLLTIDNEQVNYVTGYGNGKFYIALLNQSNKDLVTEVIINPDLVPVDPNGTHIARLWEDNQTAKHAKLENGKIKVHLSPKGITALAIDNVSVTTQFQQTIVKNTDNEPHDKSYKMVDSPFGKIRSAILSLGKVSNAYIWLEASDEQVEKAVLNYRINGAKEWTRLEDASYPFEFSVSLQEKNTVIEWWAEAKLINGKTNSSTKTMLEK